MPLTIRCPSCGKIQPLRPADLGGAVRCVACGESMQCPSLIELRVAAQRPGSGVVEASGCEPPAPVPAAGRQRHGHRALVGALLLCLVVLAGGAAYTVRALRLRGPTARLDANSPAPATRPAEDIEDQLLALKAQAEDLAIAGRLQEAHEKYRQLERRLATQKISDPALRATLERARQDQDRIYAILLGAVERGYVPRTGEPAEGPGTARRQPPTTAAAGEAGEAPARRWVPAAGTDAGRNGQKAVRPPRRLIHAGAELDEQIGVAISRGMDLLLGQMRDGEVVLGREVHPTYRQALNALVAWALLEGALATGDQRVSPDAAFTVVLLEKMKQHAMVADSANPAAPATYGRAMRAAALAVHNRPEDRDALAADVQWLVQAARNGAYSQGNRPVAEASDPVPAGAQAPPAIVRGPLDAGAMEAGAGNGGWAWDNANSQYGVLGVAAEANAGIEVPETYWREVEKHWTGCQLRSGEWGYRAGDKVGSLAMTAGGVASLLAAHDFTDALVHGGQVGRDPYSEALAKGLNWLKGGVGALEGQAGQGGRLGYDLFGVMRVGLESGFKHLGPLDWYRDLAARALRLQGPSGAWGRQATSAEAMIETSYHILFLSRGRHPVMMAKLRFDGYWCNRARDAANLARYASRQLQRPVNWQLVAIHSDVGQWMDAPVLSIASHEALRFREEEIARLRHYAEAGGLLFTHADADSAEFTRSVGELARKLFPRYEMKDLPADHPLYSMNGPVQPPLGLKHVSNGSRLLLVHSPTDIAVYWQTRAEAQRPNAFRLGLNLYLYAVGNGPGAHRLATAYLPAAAVRPQRSRPVARVRHHGNWDPEPFAFERLSRWRQADSGESLELREVDLKDLAGEPARLAHLTGNARVRFTDSQCEALRAYVEGGGTVLIDVCGGGGGGLNGNGFAASVADLLQRAFPGATPEQMPADHVLLRGTRPALRSGPSTMVGGASTGLYRLPHGQGQVIFTPWDITTGLVGAGAWGVTGYQPEFCLDFLDNLLTWAAAVR